LRTDLESRRVEPQHLLLKVVGGVKRVVSDVNVAGESESKLSVGEELGGD
jgi:hypothetical protein